MPAFQEGRRFHFTRRRFLYINVTSLVDVLFVLLTFVLMSTTFKTRPLVKVDLPRAGKTQVATSDERFLLAIASDGAFYLQGEPASRTDLLDRLVALRGRTGVERISVEVDRAAPAESLVFALDAARSGGYKQITVPTVHERN